MSKKFNVTITARGTLLQFDGGAKIILAARTDGEVESAFRRIAPQAAFDAARLKDLRVSFSDGSGVPTSAELIPFTPPTE